MVGRSDAFPLKGPAFEPLDHRLIPDRDLEADEYGIKEGVQPNGYPGHAADRELPVLSLLHQSVKEGGNGKDKEKDRGEVVIFKSGAANKKPGDKLGEEGNGNEKLLRVERLPVALAMR